MWYRVASKLGRRVPDLKREMPYSEFLEWCKFYQLEPWGFWSDQMHAALIASTVDNCRMTSKRRTKFSTIADYMFSITEKDRIEQKRRNVPSAKQFIEMLKTQYALAGKELEIIEVKKDGSKQHRKY